MSFGAFRGLIAVALVSVASGCSTDAFRSTVNSFHTTTDVAVKAQNASIGAYSAVDAERIRQQLVAQRVRLNLSDGCAALLLPGAKPLDCILVRGDDGQPVETPIAVPNILALGQALNDYSQSLADLAADSSADETAFTKAAGDLAVKVGALDGAIAKATGTTGLPQAKLNAIATVVSTTGNLYFEWQRVAALRRIIIAADPFVQEATRTLTSANIVIHYGNGAAAYAKLDSAADAVNVAIASGASDSALRAKEDALFKAMDDFRAYGAVSDGFAALGAAHAQLASAARRGASASELFAVLLKLADAAKALQPAVTVLTKP